MPKFGTDSRDSRRAERVVAFIDGMNLHFGILSRGLRSHTLVDPVSLVRKLLRPQPEEKKTDVLIACHLHICDSKVRRSQLPRVVITPGGMRLERPLEWH